MKDKKDANLRLISKHSRRGDWADIFCTTAWYEANNDRLPERAAASAVFTGGSTAPGSGTAAAAAGLEQLGEAADDRTTTTASVQLPGKEAGRGHYQFTVRTYFAVCRTLHPPLLTTLEACSTRALLWPQILLSILLSNIIIIVVRRLHEPPLRRRQS